jgi:hypothetical protein
MSSKEIIKLKQEEIDRSLLILTDTIRRLNGYINTYSGETATDFFYKMAEARGQIDVVANEARILFQECLERCLVDKQIPEPSIKWEKDEYGNIVKLGTYKNRPPCEICGEHRKVEFCHIIPRQIGGSNRETNIMYLCSTHHSCFDKGVLSKQEWDAISWKGRSDLAKSYAFDVLLKRQKEYWNGTHPVADMVYHSFLPLQEWIKNNLNCESINDWNKKRRNTKFIRSGKSTLG